MTKACRTQTVLWAALVHNIIFHSTIISYALTSRDFLSLALSIWFTVTLFLTLSLSRLAYLAAMPVIFAASAVTTYYYYFFGTRVDKNVVAAVVGTNSFEAAEFINPVFVVMVAACAVLGLGLGIWHYRRPRKSLPMFVLSLAALILAFCFVWPAKAGYFVPFNYIFATYDFLGEHAALKKALANQHNLADENSTVNAHVAADLVVVLVIGESARADHFGINGYDRDTTPLLRQRDDIVTYKTVYSCAAQTRIAVPCMLTRASVLDIDENDGDHLKLSLIAKESSFIPLFKKHGFATFWFSMNSVFTEYDTAISAIALTSDHNRFRSALQTSGTVDGVDGLILPHLDRALTSGSGPKLIVLHTDGSHWQYTKRYPKAFGKFTPVCEKAVPEICELQEVINGYDNSILYTDYFLNETIKRLEKRNALLLYVSDHGQSLGESGVFVHGQSERVEQRHIPMIWFASATYRRKNPAFANAIAEHKDTPTTVDTVFHSLLDCSGISVPGIVDLKESLCQGRLTVGTAK